MFERIVVTLDGSELAEVVLPYAEELMGRLHSELTLVNVCGSSEREHHERYFDLLVEKVKHDCTKYHGVPDAIVETVILEGNPAEQIIDYVETNGVDLTMMATHGRSGIGRWTMGSIADKVLRGISRPVALIRASGSRAEVDLNGLFGRILAPMDGSEAGAAALPYVAELAIKLNTKVILFQAVPEEERPGEIDWIELRELAQAGAKAYLHKTEYSLANKGIEVRCDTRFGDPASQIIEASIGVRADIIAMSTHGRSGVGRWVFGSVAEKVLRGGDTPVLLVRSPVAGMG